MVESRFAERLSDTRGLFVFLERLLIAQCPEQHVFDRLPRSEDRILRDVPDAQPFAHGARPRVRLLEPGQNLQKRRFA